MVKKYAVAGLVGITAVATPMLMLEQRHKTTDPVTARPTVSASPSPSATPEPTITPEATPAPTPVSRPYTVRLTPKPTNTPVKPAPRPQPTTAPVATTPTPLPPNATDSQVYCYEKWESRKFNGQDILKCGNDWPDNEKEVELPDGPTATPTDSFN